MNGTTLNKESSQQLNGSHHDTFLPADKLPIQQLCRHISSRVDAFLEIQSKDEQVLRVQQQTKTALDVIKTALDRYDFSELSLSYNGGKDCLVLLILYLAAISKHVHLDRLPQHPLQTVYIVSRHPFQEVEDFVCATQQVYSLSVARYNTDMKSAFQDYLKDFPKVKAIFVGTRRTDPHGADLTHFDETDHGWPQFMRIHPVIDWHYKEIWTFILNLQIPYCPLYDQGYTSLGGTTDTSQNPALRRSLVSGTGSPKVEFLPAYILEADHEERLGRDKDRKKMLT